MTPEQCSAQIRAELLALPGSFLCALPGCQVITQGGRDGRTKHQQIVHFNDQWLRGDRDA